MRATLPVKLRIAGKKIFLSLYNSLLLEADETLAWLEWTKMRNYLISIYCIEYCRQAALLELIAVQIPAL